jgi:hypothetical protein
MIVKNDITSLPQQHSTHLINMIIYYGLAPLFRNFLATAQSLSFWWAFGYEGRYESLRENAEI